MVVILCMCMCLQGNPRLRSTCILPPEIRDTIMNFCAAVLATEKWPCGLKVCECLSRGACLWGMNLSMGEKWRSHSRGLSVACADRSLTFFTQLSLNWTRVNRRKKKTCWYPFTSWLHFSYFSLNFFDKVLCTGWCWRRGMTGGMRSELFPLHYLVKA